MGGVSMKQRISEKLKEDDLRLTPQRTAILKAITKSEKKHFSAEEIYTISKKLLSTIGLATVYRTLDLFCTKEILQKISLPGHPTRYEVLKGETNNHCHYVCQKCGEIFELPLSKDKILKKTEQKKFDFTVTEVSCWYFGYCSNCKTKK